MGANMSEKELDLLEQELLSMSKEHVEDTCNGSNKTVEHHTKVLTLMSKVLIDVRHGIRDLQGELESYNVIQYKDSSNETQEMTRQRFIQTTIDRLSPAKQLKKASSWIMVLKPIAIAIMLAVYFTTLFLGYTKLQAESIDKVKINKNMEVILEKLEKIDGDTK